ncbi:hypothetical protein ABK040_013280 [Willaertia magna]
MSVLKEEEEKQSLLFKSSDQQYYNNNYQSITTSNYLQHDDNLMTSLFNLLLPENSNLWGKDLLVCSNCMKVYSALDFNKWYDIWDDNNDNCNDSSNIDNSITIDYNNNNNNIENYNNIVNNSLSNEIFIEEDLNNLLNNNLLQQQKKKLLIIIHGALGNRLNGILQILELKKYYRVIAFDLPQHGSRMFNNFYHFTMNNTINDILQILKDEDLLINDNKNDENNKDYNNCDNNNRDYNNNIKIKDPIILFGSSLGGYVAYEFCKRFPHFIHALIIHGAMNDYNFKTPFLFKIMHWTYKLLPKRILFNLVHWTYPMDKYHVQSRDGNNDRDKNCDNDGDSLLNKFPEKTVSLMDFVFKRAPMNYKVWDKCAVIMRDVSVVNDALTNFIKNTNQQQSQQLPQQEEDNNKDNKKDNICDYNNKNNKSLGNLLFFVGEKDFRLNEREIKECFVKCNERKERVMEYNVIPNGSHPVLFEKTKMVNDMILKFLERCENFGKVL